MKTQKTKSLLGRSSALLAVPIGLLTSFHANTFAAWPSVSFSCLGDPVESIGPVSTAAEDTQALQVLRLWAKREWSKIQPRSILPQQTEAKNALLAQEAELLYEFSTNYPGSFWTPPIQARLGQHYRLAGRYSRALELWGSAWEATKVVPGVRAKEVADFTLGRYAILLASLGRYEALTDLLAETEGRRLPFGSDSQAYNQALEAQMHMTLNPGKSYRCGTYALGRVADALFPNNNFGRILHKVPSPAVGFTLQQLSDLCRQLGIDMVPVHWANNPQIVVPSVVHWRENHYAAIMEQHGAWFKVADPTSDEHPVLVRAEDVLAETDGYFLVARPQLPSGWRIVGQQEAAAVYGRGYGTSVGDNHDEPGCPYGSSPGGVPGTVPGNGGGCAGCAGGHKGALTQPGMPEWYVSDPYINVWIFDTPLSYQPSVGSEVAVNLMWRERGLTMFTLWDQNKFTELGNSWCFPWRAAITPGSFDDVTGYGSATMCLPSGGTLGVEFFNWSNLSDHNYFNNTTLERVIDPGTQEQTAYVVHYPDGAQDVYGFVATNEYNYVIRYCLSSRIDPQGHATRIEYFDFDPAQVNTVVKRIVDPDDHALTFTYANLDLGGGYFKTNFIGQVTDWAGRTVKLGYDVNSLTLTQIVDAVNITNKLTYSFGTAWIQSLVTPYGATTFDHYQIRANHAETRYVTITGPNGAHQRYWYESADSTVPDPLDPLGDGNVVPSGTPFGDSFVVWVWDRNSYHWDARNYDALSTNFRNDPANNPPTSTDRLLGRGRHWMGTYDSFYGTVDTHTLGAERDTSPDGLVEGQLTWYNYEGKTDQDYQGTQILPAVIARVMPDGTTWYVQYTHNDYGLVTQKTEKWVQGGNAQYRAYTYNYDVNGMDLLSEYAPDGALVVGYGYDPSHPHLPVRMTNAVNEITYYTYDGWNRLLTIQTPSDLRTTNTYGADGYVQSVVDAMGTAPFRTNQYTYLNNRLRTHTDERNLTVTYTYDNLGRLTQKDYPDSYEQETYTVATPYPNGSGGTSIIDRTGHRDRLGNWTYYAWTANRQLASVTDPGTNATGYAYCTCGSLDYVTNAVNTPVQEITHYTYDLQGRQTGIYPPLGTGIISAYDLLGRVITVTDALGAATNSYDNLGRLVAVRDAGGQVSATVFDARDRVTASTDRNGVTVNITYDDLGRIRTRTYPDSGIEAFGYSANVSDVTSYTNQIPKVWLYAYDAAGRKTNEIGVDVYTNSFSYDWSGNLLTLKDGKGNVTTWKYDQYSRVTNKLDQANVEILRYQYDANNRLTNRWSKVKGNTVYSYDNVGNLTFINYPTSTDITLQYDALNRLTNMVDAAGTTKYTYYSGGLLNTEDGPWASDTVTYGYNNARLRSSLTLQQPAGSWTQNYYYDAGHRLGTNTSPAGNFLYAYSSGVGAGSSSASLVKKITLPNSSYITNIYDNVARLTGTYLDNSANTVLDKSEYLYNAGNQRIRLTRADGSYYTNTYDNIGQLVWADSTVASEDRGYLYDAAWNLNVRTNNGATSTFVVDNKNQIFSGPYGQFSYDSNGNLTSTSNGPSYSYDDENRLISISYSTVYRSDFAYDGLSRLRRRIDYTWGGSSWITGPTTYYVYDGMRVIQERDSGNTPTVSYTRGIDLSGTWEGAGGIGGFLARSHGYSSGSWTGHNFYHADGNGNITMLIDNAGTPNVTASYRYDPFGNSISATGTNSANNVYRFSSKERHVNSGMYYYGYRFYDPNLQRWLNRDPIGERGGRNLYRFVNNQPVTGNDPLGLFQPAPVFIIIDAATLGTGTAAVGTGALGAPAMGGGVAPMLIWILVQGDEAPTVYPDPFVTGVHNPVPSKVTIYLQPKPKLNPKPKDPICGEKPQCDFYKAWCEDGNKRGYRPPDDPGKYWTLNAPCDECYDECKKTGRWPMQKCKMGGPNGPRWDPKRFKPVWPDTQ